MVGGTDNGRQKTRNHGYDVIVSEYLLITPITLANLSRWNWLDQQAPDAVLSRWWDAYRKQLGLKDFSPKSRDAVALQQIKERGALPMIDRGDIRQAIDRALISGLHCRALVMVSSSIRLTAWLQNSKKRAERSERLMYEQESPRLSPLWLSASSSVSWAVNRTVITPLPTKPSATKCQRTETGEHRHSPLQMRQRDVAALDADTQELTMLKLKMMLCVMMFSLVVVSCTSKQSVSR